MCRRCFLWTLAPHAAPAQAELGGPDLDSAVSCLQWSEDGAGLVLGHEDGKVDTRTSICRE